MLTTQMCFSPVIQCFKMAFYIFNSFLIFRIKQKEFERQGGIIYDDDQYSEDKGM